VSALLAQAASEDASLTPYFLTGAVTLVVGVIAGAVAATTGLLGRRTERDKLAHEKEKFATETREKVKEDFAAVVQSMGIIELADEIDAETKSTAAGTALRGLLSISFMMPGVGGVQMEDLLDELKRADDASLRSALIRWKTVSAAIRRRPPRQR
jgi:hypothetical protein